MTLHYKHRFYDRQDGLLHCMVCNGGEGSLPSDCPGRRMTAAEEEEVYAGVLDFRGSGWWSASNFQKLPAAGTESLTQSIPAQPTKDETQS